MTTPNPILQFESIHNGMKPNARPAGITSSSSVQGTTTHVVRDPTPEFMSYLEAKGTQKTRELMQSSPSPDKGAMTAVSIIQSGNKEFFEKTGRHMTYSELRALYG